MSTLSLRLPDSLHERLRKIAAEEGISINQLVTLAAAEKVASILTVDYLEARARRADLAAYDRILDRVPAVAAQPGDELPVASSRASAARSPSEVHESSPRYATRGSLANATREKKRR